MMMWNSSFSETKRTVPKVSTPPSVTPTMTSEFSFLLLPVACISFGDFADKEELLLNIFWGGSKENIGRKREMKENKSEKLRQNSIIVIFELNYN